MQVLADGLAAQGLRIERFEFPYMQRARAEGKRKPPDRMPKLTQAYRDFVATLDRSRPLFIGGKSMGGRVASLVADDLAVSGLICLGYPFHPPGKPESLRTAHLSHLRTPTLIVQGTRDRLGNAEEVVDYPLSDLIEFCWLEDGDHSFKPRVKSGYTVEQHLQSAIVAVAHFVERVSC